MRGKFFCLDGIDGAGKSTQAERLADWLRRRGRTVVVCRDPGTTPMAERLRKVILDPAVSMSFRCEMLLFMAARAELVETVIRPALEQGRDVVCDRFVTSTYVYQGRAGGLDRVSIRHAALAACGDVIPDWTGVLDVPFEVSLKRRESTADRIEARSKEYFDRVRSGFLEEAKLDPERFSVIDGGRSADEAFEQVVREVSRVVDADRS